MRFVLNIEECTFRLECCMYPYPLCALSGHLHLIPYGFLSALWKNSNTVACGENKGKVVEMRLVFPRDLNIGFPGLILSATTKLAV